MTGDWCALVQAGGRGSRMGTDTPKPLVRVGARTLIEHNVLRALRAGAREVFVALHHRADEIEAQLRAALEDDAPLRIVREPRPLGTIGALGLFDTEAAAVLTTNGDLLSAIDFRALVAAHFASGADATVATHEERHRLQLGEVLNDGDRLTGYREKPTKTWRISSGTNVFGPRVRALVDGRTALGVPDLVQRALDDGCDLRVHPHDRPWIDVNDARDLALAEQLLQDHREDFDLR